MARHAKRARAKKTKGRAINEGMVVVSEAVEEGIVTPGMVGVQNMVGGASRMADAGGAQSADEEAEGGTKKDRFLPISILVAAILIGGALVFSSLYGSHASTPNVGAPNAGTPNAGLGASAGTAGGSSDAMKLGPRDAILGDTNAPVTIIGYGDYQCPFCTQFFSQTEPQIISNYVNAGKARMVFRNLPFLGPESTAAAEAAECANDQGKLWPYHDALYRAKVDDEAKGGGENDGSLNRALFLTLAQGLNLDMLTFTSCIDTGKDAGVVAQEKAAASAAGINSTPSFLINGTSILGAEPYAAFAGAIDAALKR